MNTPAIEAAHACGRPFEVRAIGRVRSLEDAASALGVEPRDVVKTLVVRRGDGDYLLVLVPGDREISWPKLRALLGVNRLSMPSAEDARDATGYERGTITPYGAPALPVIADESLCESERTVTVGSGVYGVSIAVRAQDLLESFDATIADVTQLRA